MEKQVTIESQASCKPTMETKGTGRDQNKDPQYNCNVNENSAILTKINKYTEIYSKYQKYPYLLRRSIASLVRFTIGSSSLITSWSFKILRSSCKFSSSLLISGINLQKRSSEKESYKLNKL